MLLRRALFLLFLLLPYTWAADAWKTPPAQWTPSDADKVLNDSPWAIRTDAFMDDPADKDDQPEFTPPPNGEGQPGATGRNAGGTNNGVRWDGGISKNRRGHLATIPVMVRWDSASVVRQALQYKHDPEAAEVKDASADNFIISVTGLLPPKQASAPATLNASSSADDEAHTRTTEEILEWFMTNSHLGPKGGDPLQPQNVKIDPDTGSVLLFFKRSDDLLAHKRDLLFATRFGSMNVHTKFRLKDMLIDGRPEL